MTPKEALEKIKDLLKFKAEFKEAKLKDGTIIRYEGDTPAAGQKVTVVTPEGEMPAPNGDLELEDGTILTIEAGVIIDVKAVQAQQNDDSEFMKYLDSDSYNTPNAEGQFAEYPWDQCIADQEQANAECPECVCAAIKNRTVNHLKQSGVAKSTKEAVDMIREKVKTDEAFKYITSKLAMKAEKKDDKKEKEMEKTISSLQKNFEKLTGNFNALKEANDILLPIVEQLAKEPDGEPVKKSKNPFVKSTEEKDIKFKKIADTLKSIKQN